VTGAMMSDMIFPMLLLLPHLRNFFSLAILTLCSQASEEPIPILHHWMS